MPNHPSTPVKEAPVSTYQSDDIVKSLTSLSLFDPTSQYEVSHPEPKKQSREYNGPTRSTSTLTGEQPALGPSLERRTSDPLPFPLHPESIEAQKADKGSILEEGNGSPFRSRRAIQRYGLFTPPVSPDRQSPDRFIPTRRTPESIIETFCSSKPPQQLTKEERFLRASSASPDPFSPRSPRHFHDPTRLSILGNFPSLSSSRGVLNTNIRPNVSIGLPTRRVSVGTVWNVGGNAAAEPNHPVNAIPNGRGGLLGSGTNAPMFSSHFFERETPNESTERFEGRLATALDIDQTRRTLEIPQYLARKKRPSLSRGSTAPGRLSNSSRTRWEHGRWVNDRIGYRELNRSFMILNHHQSYLYF